MGTISYGRGLGFSLFCLLSASGDRLDVKNFPGYKIYCHALKTTKKKERDYAIED